MPSVISYKDYWQNLLHYSMQFLKDKEIIFKMVSYSCARYALLGRPVDKSKNACVKGNLHMRGLDTLGKLSVKTEIVSTR